MTISEDIRRARRNTIGDAVRRAARKHREREALVFGDRRWSFSALDVGADRVAASLRDAGLRRGERVVAFGRNSDAYLLAWLGCVRAGLVHVPANYALTTGELRGIVAQSGAAALLHDSDLAAVGGATAGLRLVGNFVGGSGFDVLAAATVPGAPAPLADEPGDDDLVQLQYTSGTTAAPKGAMMTHSGMLWEYMSAIIDMEFSRDDRTLAALPLYHTAQMHAFMMPNLLVGAHTVLLGAPVPELVLRSIEEGKITAFFAPPTVWIGLLRHPDFARRDLSSLQKLYYGASIMPVPVLEELRARLPGARTFNCYGQSEIAPVATVLYPEEHPDRPASVGRPVLNVETRVVDLDMRDVPPGVPGEVVHRSPQLLVGYWEKPEETAAAFAGGWFHSGDLATVDAKGYMTIVDRVKDVINTGGVLVASREVEEALFTHPAIAEVAVVALPDPRWIEAVTAVVVLREGAAVTEDELVAHARTMLAPYKLPKRVIFAESLPKNTAGKLLKRELRRLYGGA